MACSRTREAGRRRFSRARRYMACNFLSRGLFTFMAPRSHAAFFTSIYILSSKHTLTHSLSCLYATLPPLHLATLNEIVVVVVPLSRSHSFSTSSRTRARLPRRRRRFSSAEGGRCRGCVPFRLSLSVTRVCVCFCCCRRGCSSSSSAGSVTWSAHYLSWPRKKARVTRIVREVGQPAAVFPCCIAAGCSPV